MRCPAAVKPATIVKADAAHKKDPKFSGTVEEAGRGVSMEFAEYGQKQLAIFARLHAVSDVDVAWGGRGVPTCRLWRARW